jgi:hypothetical protein
VSAAVETSKAKADDALVRMIAAARSARTAAGQAAAADLNTDRQRAANDLYALRYELSVRAPDIPPILARAQSVQKAVAARIAALDVKMAELKAKGLADSDVARRSRQDDWRQMKKAIWEAIYGPRWDRVCTF